MGFQKIEVIGIGRSGTHAVSSWFAGQFDSSLFASYSEIFYRKKSPYYTSEKTIEKRVGNKNDIFKDIKQLNVNGLVLKAEQKALTSNIKNFYKEEWSFLRNDFEKLGSENNKNILLLRNPYNVYASLIQWKYKSPFKNNVDLFINSWISYAQEFLGETSYIPNKVSLYYDEWVLNKEYRRKISAMADTFFNDKYKEQKSSGGGGSSFSNDNFLKRHQNVNNPSMILLKDNDRINNYYLKILENVKAQG